MKINAPSCSGVVTTGLLAAVAAAALVAAVTVAPRQAAAKPEFAAQTGLPCGQCHVNPGGGGPRKPFGEKFKANGYKLPGK
jgi:cytochrome c553